MARGETVVGVRADSTLGARRGGGAAQRGGARTRRGSSSVRRRHLRRARAGTRPSVAGGAHSLWRLRRAGRRAGRRRRRRRRLGAGRARRAGRRVGRVRRARRRQRGRLFRRRRGHPPAGKAAGGQMKPSGQACQEPPPAAGLALRHADSRPSGAATPLPACSPPAGPPRSLFSDFGGVDSPGALPSEGLEKDAGRACGGEERWWCVRACGGGGSGWGGRRGGGGSVGGARDAAVRQGVAQRTCTMRQLQHPAPSTQQPAPGGSLGSSTYTSSPNT